MADRNLVGGNSRNGGNLSSEKLGKAGSKHQIKHSIIDGAGGANKRWEPRFMGLSNQFNCSVG